MLRRSVSRVSARGRFHNMSTSFHQHRQHNKSSTENRATSTRETEVKDTTPLDASTLKVIENSMPLLDPSSTPRGRLVFSHLPHLASNLEPASSVGGAVDEDDELASVEGGEGRFSEALNTAVAQLGESRYIAKSCGASNINLVVAVAQYIAWTPKSAHYQYVVNDLHRWVKRHLPRQPEQRQGGEGNQSQQKQQHAAIPQERLIDLMDALHVVQGKYNTSYDAQKSVFVTFTERNPTFSQLTLEQLLVVAHTAVALKQTYKELRVAIFEKTFFTMTLKELVELGIVVAKLNAKLLPRKWVSSYFSQLRRHKGITGLRPFQTQLFAKIFGWSDVLSITNLEPQRTALVSKSVTFAKIVEEIAAHPRWRHDLLLNQLIADILNEIGSSPSSSGMNYQLSLAKAAAVMPTTATCTQPLLHQLFDVEKLQIEPVVDVAVLLNCLRKLSKLAVRGNGANFNNIMAAHAHLVFSRQVLAALESSSSPDLHVAHSITMLRAARLSRTKDGARIVSEQYMKTALDVSYKMMMLGNRSKGEGQVSRMHRLLAICYIRESYVAFKSPHGTKRVKAIDNLISSHILVNLEQARELLSEEATNTLGQIVTFYTARKMHFDPETGERTYAYRIQRLPDGIRQLVDVLTEHPLLKDSTIAVLAPLLVRTKPCLGDYVHTLCVRLQAQPIMRRAQYYHEFENAMALCEMVSKVVTDVDGGQGSVPTQEAERTRFAPMDLDMAEEFVHRVVADLIHTRHVSIHQLTQLIGVISTFPWKPSRDVSRSVMFSAVNFIFFNKERFDNPMQRQIGEDNSGGVPAPALVNGLVQCLRFAVDADVPVSLSYEQKMALKTFSKYAMQHAKTCGNIRIASILNIAHTLHIPQVLDDVVEAFLAGIVRIPSNRLPNILTGWLERPHRDVHRMETVNNRRLGSVVAGKDEAMSELDGEGEGTSVGTGDDADQKTLDSAAEHPHVDQRQVALAAKFLKIAQRVDVGDLVSLFERLPIKKFARTINEVDDPTVKLIRQKLFPQTTTSEPSIIPLTALMCLATCITPLADDVAALLKEDLQKPSRQPTTNSGDVEESSNEEVATTTVSHYASEISANASQQYMLQQLQVLPADITVTILPQLLKGSSLNNTIRMLSQLSMVDCLAWNAPSEETLVTITDQCGELLSNASTSDRAIYYNVLERFEQYHYPKIIAIANALVDPSTIRSANDLNDFVSQFSFKLKPEVIIRLRAAIEALLEDKSASLSSTDVNAIIRILRAKRYLTETLSTLCAQRLIELSTASELVTHLQLWVTHFDVRNHDALQLVIDALFNAVNAPTSSTPSSDGDSGESSALTLLLEAVELLAAHVTLRPVVEKAILRITTLQDLSPLQFARFLRAVSRLRMWDVIPDVKSRIETVAASSDTNSLCMVLRAVSVDKELLGTVFFTIEPLLLERIGSFGASDVELLVQSISAMDTNVHNCETLFSCVLDFYVQNHADPNYKLRKSLHVNILKSAVSHKIRADHPAIDAAVSHVITDARRLSSLDTLAVLRCCTELGILPLELLHHLLRRIESLTHDAAPRSGAARHHQVSTSTVVGFLYYLAELDVEYGPWTSSLMGRLSFHELNSTVRKSSALTSQMQRVCENYAAEMPVKLREAFLRPMRSAQRKHLESEQQLFQLDKELEAAKAVAEIAAQTTVPSVCATQTKKEKRSRTDAPRRPPPNRASKQKKLMQAKKRYEKLLRSPPRSPGTPPPFGPPPPRSPGTPPPYGPPPPRQPSKMKEPRKNSSPKKTKAPSEVHTVVNGRVML